jgi:hypothetical protein
MKKVFAVMKNDVLILSRELLAPYLIVFLMLAATVFLIYILASVLTLYPLTTIGTLSGLLLVSWLYTASLRAKEGDQE